MTQDSSTSYLMNNIHQGGDLTLESDKKNWMRRIPLSHLYPVLTVTLYIIRSTHTIANNALPSHRPKLSRRQEQQHYHCVSYTLLLLIQLQFYYNKKNHKNRHKMIIILEIFFSCVRFHPVCYFMISYMFHIRGQSLIIIPSHPIWLQSQIMYNARLIWKQFVFLPFLKMLNVSQLRVNRDVR